MKIYKRKGIFYPLTAVLKNCIFDFRFRFYTVGIGESVAGKQRRFGGCIEGSLRTLDKKLRILIELNWEEFGQIRSVEIWWKLTKEEEYFNPLTAILKNCIFDIRFRFYPVGIGANVAGKQRRTGGTVEWSLWTFCKILKSLIELNWEEFDQILQVFRGVRSNLTRSGENLTRCRRSLKHCIPDSPSRFYTGSIGTRIAGKQKRLAG